MLVLTSYTREDIECQIMFIDPILVAVPKGHRLADRNSISLTELRDESFVGVKKATELEMWWIQYANRLDLYLHMCMKVMNLRGLVL